MVEIHHSTCPHDCPSTCLLEVEKLSETEIGRVHGAKDNDYTSGVVCAKVARYAERIHHPERLMKPLRRVGDKGIGIEAFEEITWDQALDEIVARFEGVKEEFGSEAIWPYHFAGTMGLVMRDGLDRFRHAYRTTRQYSTICTALPDSGWHAGHGIKHGNDPREIAESDLIVVWGGNPVSTQVNVMTHISKARKDRGAKLVVIDVYKTPSVQAADYGYIIRPGTDGALATALMHIMFRDGYADRNYMAKYADVPEELETHVSDKTPQWAAQITGLSVAEIEELATLYGKTDRAFLRVGYGFARSRNGAVNMHAVTCLPVITGKWLHKGAGALYGNAGMYPIDWTLVMGLDVRDTTIRSLDMCRLGAILLGEKGELQGGPPVKAMLVQNTNPASVCPDQNKVLAGFRRDDLFLVVHEQFMTETAAYADIVLPATMFLEHHDMYTGGGHVYFSVTKPVIEAALSRIAALEHVCEVSLHRDSVQLALSQGALRPAAGFRAMASLVDAPSMTVDPAEPARGSTPPSKSQKKREQRRRAAERKRAAAGVPDAAAAPEPAPPGTAPGIAPGTAPDAAATTPPQLSPEQIAAMVSAAKKNMAEVDPNASPEDKVKAAMQALQLVTGVLQSRGGDDEVMRQLQAAKARAATERKLKGKLKGMKESR